MPNWCRNEVKFGIYSFDGSDLILESLLDFLKETIPNYNHRVNVAKVAHERKQLEAKEAGKQNWWSALSNDIKERSIFDFNNLLPYPIVFKERDDDSQLLSKEAFLEKYGDDKDGYNHGGYDWCVKHWKTKWGPTNAVWVARYHTLCFDTAWGPSLPIISALHKRFPEIHIYYEYYEKGAAFIGGCEFIPEDEWSPNDYTLEEVNTIEQHTKRFGKAPDSKWEAGKAYNPWSMDYLGYKGG